MGQHDKIISMTAKKVLAPHGLFREGRSRCWLEDNGYYITFVVFDSSRWMKASTLGVGIDFLWEKIEGLNQTLSYSYGGSTNKFCEYRGNDDAFQAKVEEQAKLGLEKAIEYRKFKDMDYAKKCFQQRVLDTPEKRRFWEVYDLAMICFLKGDLDEGVSNFESYLDILKNSFYIDDLYIDWHETFYNHCIQHIKPYLTSKETAQKMVLDMINRRRDFFNNKPSYKKMSKEKYRIAETR